MREPQPTEMASASTVHEPSTSVHRLTRCEIRGEPALTSLPSLPTLAELTPSASGPLFLQCGFIRPLIERSSKRLGLSRHFAYRRDTAMPTGTIARLLIDKGFGFIRD